ncbi:MAG: hypothetical protein QW728_04255 [Thermoplasmata archaeon]
MVSRLPKGKKGAGSSLEDRLPCTLTIDNEALQNFYGKLPLSTPELRKLSRCSHNTLGQMFENDFRKKLDIFTSPDYSKIEDLKGFLLPAPLSLQRQLAGVRKAVEEAAGPVLWHIFSPRLDSLDFAIAAAVPTKYTETGGFVSGPAVIDALVLSYSLFLHEGKLSAGTAGKLQDSTLMNMRFLLPTSLRLTSWVEFYSLSQPSVSADDVIDMIQARYNFEYGEICSSISAYVFSAPVFFGRKGGSGISVTVQSGKERKSFMPKDVDMLFEDIHSNMAPPLGSIPKMYIDYNRKIAFSPSSLNLQESSALPLERKTGIEPPEAIRIARERSFRPRRIASDFKDNGGSTSLTKDGDGRDSLSPTELSFVTKASAVKLNIDAKRMDVLKAAEISAKQTSLLDLPVHLSRDDFSIDVNETELSEYGPEITHLIISIITAHPHSTFSIPEINRARASLFSRVRKDWPEVEELMISGVIFSSSLVAGVGEHLTRLAGTLGRQRLKLKSGGCVVSTGRDATDAGELAQDMEQAVMVYHSLLGRYQDELEKPVRMLKARLEELGFFESRNPNMDSLAKAERMLWDLESEKPEGFTAEEIITAIKITFRTGEKKARDMARELMEKHLVEIEPGLYLPVRDCDIVSLLKKHSK